MTEVELRILPIKSDPDVEVGGYLTLERADGRSLWKQRFVVIRKNKTKYTLQPVDEWGNII